MSLDLSTEYLLIDDPLTLTLFQKTGEGSYDAGTTVAYCQRSAVTKDDAIINPAILQKTATVFHTWKANLSSKVPKSGDRIKDGLDVNWTVKRAEELDRDANGTQRYRLTCTKEI